MTAPHFVPESPLQHKDWRRSTMPYYATSQEWHTQSSLLLQARPTTVRAARLPSGSFTAAITRFANVGTATAPADAHHDQVHALRLRPLTQLARLPQ